MPGRIYVVLTTLRKVLLRLIVLLVVIFAGSILYANLFGIPDPLLKSALNRVNRGSFAIVVESAKLRGLTHLRLDEFAIYRKRVLGKPLLSASSVKIDLSLIAWLRGESVVAGVLVEDPVLIPRQGVGSQTHHADNLQNNLSFPVVVKNGHFHDLTFKRLDFQFIGLGSEIRFCDMKAAVSRDEPAGGKVVESNLSFQRHKVVGDEVAVDANAVVGGATRVDNGLLVGRVTGAMSYDMEEGRLGGELVTHLSPHAVMTFLSEYNIPFAGTLIERFGFVGEVPRVKWVFYYYAAKDGDIYLSGDFRMRDCSYRGIDFLRADGLFNVSRLDGDVQAELNRLFVVREEGIANVSFVAKPFEMLLDFEAESSLHPMAMARMVGVLTNVLSKHVDFNGPSTVSAMGIVDYGGNHSNTDFRATIKADDVKINKLHCDSGSFDVHMQGRNVALTNIEATAYSGTVSGSVNMRNPLKGESNFPYSVNVELDDAGFEEFMKSVASTNRHREYHGSMSGSLIVEGIAGAGFVKNLNGKGSLRISNGRVFMMPVFGGLSIFMTKMIPGLSFILSQSDAKSKFKIDSGVVNTDEVEVEGDVLSLKGNGTYVLNGELDFDVQVKLMKGHTLGGKVFRFLTYPLSKLFEFKVKGSLDDPHWYPENFSLDLLKKIGIGKEDKQE